MPDLDRPRGRESGFTVIELMIALLIFSLFLTIVLTSVIALTRTSTKAQVTAQSSSAELAMFQRLDHEIRYSDSINFPGTGSSGDYYIEFRTPAETSTGVTLCTQWRFVPSTGQIQMRTWNDTTGVVAGNTWDTLLTNVSTSSATGYPFLLIPASAAGSSMQELQLTVNTGNANATGASIISTFVARNSSIVDSPSNSDAKVPGVSDTPICLGSTRP